MRAIVGSFRISLGRRAEHVVLDFPGEHLELLRMSPEERHRRELPCDVKWRITVTKGGKSLDYFSESHDEAEAFFLEALAGRGLTGRT